MSSVIITGCTSGVGLAFHDLVTRSSSPIFQYIFIGRELGRLNQQVKQTYYELDLSKSGHIDWTSVYGKKPPKKITFISNAGTIDPIGRITVNNADILRKAVNVNLISPIEMISSLILWAESNSVSIRVINISSGAANNPIAGWGSYCMSKAGIKMFFDVISKENDFVEVEHFDPGVIDTAMQEKIRGSERDAMPSVDNFKKIQQEGQLKKPEDVAAKLMFMCGRDL
ncbi:SDR family NAD(P)-dependent oxidoreductase [Aliivibrio logei]|uniref:Short-chain dehydrogenase n=1 Tax=Aliivibrio logei TaxID=688 RepID=A0A1B9NVI0_ALILO|nr:SDR family NAD(P)-dependent oxidoreductase [Aliivibrio logei]OCH18568.1 hypothetical protein A6E04_01735 [Aliivibrio logei]